MTGDKMDPAAAVKLAKKFPGLKGMDLAKVVTAKRSFQWNEGSVWPENLRAPIRSHQRMHVAAYDFGVKRNILRVVEHDFSSKIIQAAVSNPPRWFVCKVNARWTASLLCAGVDMLVKPLGWL